MEQYVIRFTAQARQHLRLIRDYIAVDLREPEIAKKLLELLQKEISTLSYMPYRVKLIEEKPWRDMGFRKIRVKNYYIYFWVNDDTKEVNIIAVIYVRRDQAEQLESHIWRSS
ncbi:type II toxin-antitoxin system RelE/ParE family toxin [Varibaculum cambriense]